MYDAIAPKETKDFGQQFYEGIGQHQLSAATFKVTNVMLCTYQLHAPGYPPPPPPGDGGDLTRVGVKCILNPHQGTDEMVKQPHPVHAEITRCRLASVNVPHPRNPPCGQIPHPQTKRSGQIPCGLRGGGGGGGGGLQLIGALNLSRLRHNLSLSGYLG